MNVRIELFRILLQQHALHSLHSVLAKIALHTGYAHTCLSDFHFALRSNLPSFGFILVSARSSRALLPAEAWLVFFPSHRAKRGSPVGHHATVNLQNSNFRPLAVTWSLHAPLIKDHARNRVEMRPQICENGNLRCESSWNSCLIFLFFYVIYIYIYIFVFDRRDIVDLIENTDSL